MENYNENSKQIGLHYMINNGLTDLSANGALTVIDKRNAIAYSVYLSSEKKLGESDELVKIAKYCILQPTNVEWFTVFDNSIDFAGARLSECNIIDLNKDTVRVYAMDMTSYNYYYKDVDKKTLKVGELKLLKYKPYEDKEPVIFSRENLNAHIRELGGLEYAHMQLTTEILVVDGVYYATVCGGNERENFFFIKSTDGEVWEYVSMVKHPINYEAMLAFNDNKFWVMVRKGGTLPSDAKQQNLMYSEDMGKTWKQSNLALETSDTRPYLFNYLGELYLAYSSPLPDDYSTVRAWRCNIHIGKIVTNNGLQTFEEVIYKESKFGIVYFSVHDWYGKMILIYSSGELYPKKGLMGSRTQGKDSLNYAILQEEDPILTFD